MADVISPLALRVPVLRTYKRRKSDNVKVPFKPFRKGQPSAILYHTTGGGLAKAAANWTAIGKKKSPALAKLLTASKVWTETDVMIVIYLNDGMGVAHTCCAYDGTVYAHVSERLATPHAGTSAAERVALSTDEWRAYVPDAFEVEFAKLFPLLKSPLALTDGQSANPRTLAMEIAQLARRDRITGMLQTVEQYEAAAAWGVDASRRHGFELPGYEARIVWGNRKNADRLLWHGLVQPFDRTDKRGEWDPGILRTEPTFSLERMVHEIGKAKVAASRVSA